MRLLLAKSVEHDNSIQTKRRSLARRSRFRSLVALLRLLLVSPRFLHNQSFAILAGLQFQFIGSGSGVVFTNPAIKKFQGCSTNPELIGRRIMAMKCEYCGKAPSYGNVVSHANNTRRRRWNPNLKSVRALVSGARKRVKVCTACIRAGKVKKAA